MKTALILLLTLLTLSSCKKTESKEKAKIKTTNWLLGKWESKTNDGVISENWKSINDSTFEGKSFFIKNNDTLHFENIILQQKGENLIYSTIVKGQNENKSVSFKLTLDSINKLVFENTNHDYPQKITYKLIAKDSLVAILSGKQLGKESTEFFGMKKTE